MRKLLSLTTCFATLTCGMAYAQNAPVRNTLQAVGGAIDRTTDATARTVRGAANVTDRAARTAIRGSANVVDRTTGAAARTVKGGNVATVPTTNAAGRILGNTVLGTQQTLQGAGSFASPQMNFDNGYSNEYVQAQSMGQTWHQGMVSSQNAAIHTLLTDQFGREYICLGGQRVYVDNPNAMATSEQAPSQRQDEAYQAAYGSYDSETSSNEAAINQTSEETEQNSGQTQQESVSNTANEDQAERAENNELDRRAENLQGSVSAASDTEIESQQSGNAGANSGAAADAYLGEANADASVDVGASTQDASQSELSLELDTDLDSEVNLDATE